MISAMIERLRVALEVVALMRPKGEADTRAAMYGRGQ